MKSFNFQRFLREKWGDPDRLTSFLHGYDHKEFARPTVNQWFRRKSVPATAFAILVVLLQIEHGVADLVEYLE